MLLSVFPVLFVLVPYTLIRQGRGLGTDRKSGELKKGGGTELGSPCSIYGHSAVCVCVSPSVPDIQLQGFPHTTSGLSSATQKGLGVKPGVRSLILL